MALGADRPSIVRMVVQQGMSIAAAGLLLGILGALAATRSIATLLYEVTPTDPTTFAVAAALLTATALVACCAPAIQAARIDPLIALRYE